MTCSKLALRTLAGLGIAVICGCNGEVSVETSGAGGGGSGGASSGGGTSVSTSTVSSGTVGGGGATTSGTTSSTSSTTTSTGTGTLTGGDGTFAVHKFLVGDKLPNGSPSSTAWKGYGFDLDGKVSTAASVDLCKPAVGGKASAVYPDGDAGIDNAFGKNILPILTSLSGDFSGENDAATDQGRFTVLVRIPGLGPSEVGVFPAQAFTAAFAAGAMPAWDGADAWPVRSDCLVGGDLASPKAQFPASAVTEDASGARVWRSVSAAEMRLELVAGGFTMALPLHAVRLSMELSPNNATATRGQIGGVLDTEAFLDELAKVAGSFDPSLCPPSATFESIGQQIRQAQDILLDGTQNPAVTCNGISLGLGFEAEATGLGGAFVAPIPPDPCGP